MKWRGKDSKRCPMCGGDKPLTDYYVSRSRPTPSVYCKPCSNQKTIQRQQALKLKAIEYKGSKCLHCGYNRYAGALDLHHRDPSQKEFNLSHAALTSFEKVKAELDKCDLLCANCHREEHARLKAPKRRSFARKGG